MAKLRFIIYLGFIALGGVLCFTVTAKFNIVDGVYRNIEQSTHWVYGLPIIVMGLVLILFDWENLAKELKVNGKN